MSKINQKLCQVASGALHCESYIFSFQLYESAKISRRPDAGPIKFVELNGHHGHKMIYQSEKLPGIVRYV